MTMSVNGLHESIRTSIARFPEEQHRNEMTLARLTQEAQDLSNSLCIQMAQLHAEPVKSTRDATVKIGHTIRPTRTSPPSRQVHLMESIINTGEGLLLAEEDKMFDPDNSIDTDDLL